MESFTVRAGLGVCEELRKLCGAELFVKWPNDIYSRGGMKVAGMLAELEIGADSAAAVFGIGVNVDFSGLSEDEIPDEIRGAACDLRSLSGGDFPYVRCRGGGGRRSFGRGKIPRADRRGV